MSSEPDRLPILRLLPPDSDLRRGGDVALSTVTRLIASGMAASKAELSAATGLSRTTITGVVDRLLRAEPTLAPPPEPVPADLAGLHALAAAERAKQCDAPRDSGWRPGARWARSGEPKGQTFLEWVDSDAYDEAGIKADFRANMWGRLLTEGVLKRE